jgi:hypothetical protein
MFRFIWRCLVWRSRWVSAPPPRHCVEWWQITRARRRNMLQTNRLGRQSSLPTPWQGTRYVPLPSIVAAHARITLTKCLAYR